MAAMLAHLGGDDEALLRYARPMRHWLMKSEPDVYSIADLERDGASGWEGVRNYQARNFMRDDMKPGDLVLFYHSNAEPSGVAGVARVDGAALPDPSQFDKKSEYYDAASTKAAPRWQMVRVAFVERFARVVPLELLKNDGALAGMLVLAKGQRLSVQPVDPKHFARVCALARG
jgi:predicted RNA-binding protein with PUA-like domain